jgi:predicted phosphohydrolase
MSIWAVADIHASRLDPETGQPAKPMDIFGPGWERHVDRLEAAWEANVQPTDIVIIAGDIDWALRLEDAAETLTRIAGWPGRKILLRGNHDYWWSSKTTNKVRRCLPDGIDLLYNNALVAEGFNICGAKGSPVPGGIDWSEQDAKLLNREVQRLDLSLQARDPALPTIVALHYPPFHVAHPASPYRVAIERAHVSGCVYGHLHGTSGGSGPRGCIGGVEYYLVAGDAVDFKPVLIASDGAIMPRQHETEATGHGTSATAQ